jgi:hypothetical protein
MSRGVQVWILFILLGYFGWAVGLRAGWNEYRKAATEEAAYRQREHDAKIFASGYQAAQREKQQSERTEAQARTEPQ